MAASQPAPISTPAQLDMAAQQALVTALINLNLSAVVDPVVKDALTKIIAAIAVGK